MLGEGVKPEHLNDDRLGNVLDEVYATGLSELFLEISLAAADKFEVKRETAHLDSRVPLSISAAATLVDEVVELAPSGTKGYTLKESTSEYAEARAALVTD